MRHEDARSNADYRVVALQYRDRMKALQDITASQLWDALREQCCSTRPSTDATVIVMLRRSDVEAALSHIQSNGERKPEDPSSADSLNQTNSKGS